MITLQGLNPFTSYIISVSASTSVGPGPSTPSVIVTTPQAGRLHTNVLWEGSGGEGREREGEGIDDRVKDIVGANSTSIIIWKGREGREGRGGEGREG